MLDINASYYCMQFQGKLMNQTCENAKKTLISSPILPHLVQIWGNKLPFLWVLPLLDVRHCCKLKKMAKKADFRPKIRAQFFFQKCGLVSNQISWSAIIMYNIRKTNDPILRNLVTNGRKEQMDKSDFIERWPTKLEHSK